jgi:hypothetical protein
MKVAPDAQAISSIVWTQQNTQGLQRPLELSKITSFRTLCAVSSFG